MELTEEQNVFWNISWRRVGRRTLIGSIGVFALIHLYILASGASYAMDFHYGIWPAARDLIHGRSPYPPANPSRLLSLRNAFVTPPLVAVIAAPLVQFRFGAAIILWNALSACSLVVALRLLGVRELRLYILALASIPMIDSLEIGQPDAVFALALAVTWRYRDFSRGAVALGALIAAKLLAVPLLLWLLATRRFRSFALASGSCVLFLIGSWALIGFSGLTSYPTLLAADARAFEAWNLSLSLTGALMHLGTGEAVARILAVAIALVIGGTILAVARYRDQGWFIATLTFGLLASPIMWLHYLTILFVPIAIARDRRLGLWLVPSAVLWLTFVALSPSGELRYWTAITTVVAVAIWSVVERHVDDADASSASPGAVGPHGHAG